MLAGLQHLARARVWTSQQGEITLPLENVEVSQFSGEAPSIRMLKEADPTFDNPGNNGRFYGDIRAAARRAR